MALAAEVVRVDPDVLGGTPVFPGTRVPVETLFAYLQEGHRVEDFRADFPSVTREQAEAVLDWAGRHIATAA
ncbi:DUF433 domain-containing protein [Alienimonas chondri]|uniref:DUF433 domain-containing protein n=1 Tax=Alienimonas chondri TaxID=2681879 RepID=A0ABX1V8B9_9PLAN|nr:DUF433 domain-containing protein [Alienimonas chondri]NNJ24400.1 hypothetical protein [Alienimonas chondri]